MARLKLCDGRNHLYQWDTGVQIEVCGCKVTTECHFVTPSGLIKRDVVDGICDVPDVALQHAGHLTVYAFTRDEGEGNTRHEFRIRVFPRPKPADYIDPPEEADYIDQLYDRLKDEIVGPPGEKGDPGQRGSKWIMIATNPYEGYHGVLNGVECNGRKLIADICKEGRVTEVHVGDILAMPNVSYVYYVVAVDDQYAYISFDYEMKIRGNDGVGIKSLEQTTTSTEDGGENVWTATLEPYGGTKTFSVRNGSKGSPGVAGKDGYTPVKGVDYFDGAPGKDGTSVTITNITQSTEDDGYSVVTFSDGKQLKVKNGSKGSPGEGGSGGSSDPEVVTVMCVPDDDFQSFTADKGFEDIYMALADGKLVQAYVHVLGAYAPIVLFNDGMAMFGVTLAMEGNVIAVSLVMSADGTNILSALPIIGEPGEGEEETAKDTLVVTYEDYGNGSSMVTHTVEQIYAEYTAGRKVVLLIADGVLYHAEHISSDECRFVRYSFDADGGGTRSVAVLPNYGMVKFTNEVIPADRPNPHPLVINGVSYDGSKRVEIKEGEYELIETITLEEEATILHAKQEPDGTPYAFRAVIVEIATGDKSTVAGDIAVYAYTDVGVVVSGYGIGGAIAVASKRYITYKAEEKHGVYDTDITNAGWTKESLTTLHKQPKVVASSAGHIADIRIMAINNSVLPVGTEVKILGVRA